MISRGKKHEIGYPCGAQSYVHNMLLIWGFSYGTVIGATTAILCSDGNSTFGLTRPAFGAYFKELQQQSQLMGNFSAQIRIGCIAWDTKPKCRYSGPFARETATPVLLVGTAEDTATPICKKVVKPTYLGGLEVLIACFLVRTQCLRTCMGPPPCHLRPRVTAP